MRFPIYLKFRELNFNAAVVGLRGCEAKEGPKRRNILHYGEEKLLTPK